MKHINIALFVPHAGCPHQCCFCNQKSISGSTQALKCEDVSRAIEVALGGRDTIEAELAFFGGSFTAIEREYMISLLEQTRYYTQNGIISGIRISTRPDAIDEQVLDILKHYGVTSIELGCQSMDDRVLSLCERGHTAKDVENACAMIKARGFSLGVQMMTGLPGDTHRTCIETAEKLIALSPDTCRIYPTIVLEQTPLADMLKRGEYEPQTLDDAVTLCARLLKMFSAARIPVIRLGLHSGGNVEQGYLAGAYHPAFRELCEGEIFYDNILSVINERVKTVYVPKGKISCAIGHGRKNMKRFEQAGYRFNIKEDNTLNTYDIRIDEETK